VNFFSLSDYSHRVPKRSVKNLEYHVGVTGVRLCVPKEADFQSD
jgi:hypothetical protein